MWQASSRELECMYSDAGGWQRLPECVEESRLSHHQEQASSDTCSQFVHQHVQLQSEPERPQTPRTLKSAPFPHEARCCLLEVRRKKKRFMVSKYRAKIYCADESYTLNTQVEAQMLLKVNSLIGDFTASHARGRLILWEKGGRWSTLVEICLSLDRLKCVSRRGFFVSQQCQNTGTVK